MCGCETNETQTTASQAVEGRDYLVGGMSCQPCAAKVSAAVRAVPGVTDMYVDLAAGRITVAGTATDAAIHAAVTDAGYTITNP
jgi:copper chaperone